MSDNGKVSPGVAIIDADARLLADMIGDCREDAVQRDNIGTGGGGHLHLMNLGIGIVAEIPVDGDEQVIMIMLGMQSRADKPQHQERED